MKESCPPLLSLGKICKEDKIGFTWPAGKDEPYLQLDKHNRIFLRRKNNVPWVTAACKVADKCLPSGEVDSETSESPVQHLETESESEGPSSHAEPAGRESEPVGGEESAETDTAGRESTPAVKKGKKPKLTQQQRRQKQLQESPIRCDPSASHNLLTHFPKDANCPVCQACKTQKARCHSR